MMNTPLVSIVITNHNYGRYLSAALDSALEQSWPMTEVIVVDDGSTDGSRTVLQRYEGRVTVAYKENGGQASAFNEGFRISKGDIILFLDADDLLFRDAVATIVPLFGDVHTAKVHWPLRIVDGDGQETGDIIPGTDLPDGDFRMHALSYPPPFFLNPPTTGNAWSRRFLETVMPMPELAFRIGADTYLFETAALFGKVHAHRKPMGAYRIHGGNNYHTKGFSEKLDREIEFYESIHGILLGYAERLGLEPQADAWEKRSWFHMQKESIGELVSVIPPGGTCIFIDDNTWGIGPRLEGRRILPFTEKDGNWNGNPADDGEAMAELKRLRSEGAGYLAIAGNSNWWKEHYRDFCEHLSSHSNLILENERLTLFEIQKS